MPQFRESRSVGGSQKKYLTNIIQIGVSKQRASIMRKEKRADNLPAKPG